MVEAAVSAALSRIVPAGADPLVRRSERADFQSQAALALAGRLHRPAAELAADLAVGLDTDLVTATVSGPGFVNVTVHTGHIWSRLAAQIQDVRLGAGEPLHGTRVVLDYSGPNIAKELHVGHLRSTVIGDALARTLGFLGADVNRQNHFGDWGTQFGMLIQHLAEHPEIQWRQADDAGAVSALDGLYNAARARFDAEPDFAGRARERVVALQAGDPETVAAWRDLVAESERAFGAVYDRLGVLLTPADADGESRYNAELPGIVDELLEAGIAVHSNGAVCVFFDDITGPDGEPVPLIVRKDDGGFGYAATDLATVRHRVRDLAGDRLLYVVDLRQALHFRMVFATARRAGWLPEEVRTEHVSFGTVLRADGRPFRSRDGGTVPLRDLLDAAVDRAREVAAGGVGDPEQLGIGAVKYADLSTSRTRDYAFDLERMVSLSGNTSVYVQYAHARMCSILAKVADADPPVSTELPMHRAERTLALTLDEYGTVLSEVADTLEPHRLCGYLFDLAKTYTDFYESCPVLSAETVELRGNRLALCRLSAAILAHGLGLLGIAAPERM
jgi:arginyl-tRNA synthetase